MVVSLFAASLALADVPARYQHQDYQRLERRVSMHASERHVLVRRGPLYTVSGVEKVLSTLGWLHGLSGHLMMREHLAELDLGSLA